MDGEKRITTDILRKAVSVSENVEEGSVIIEDFKIEAGSKRGDGFMCSILNISGIASIDSSKRPFTFIGKVTPDNPVREIQVKEAKFMEAEVYALQVLIPTFKSYSKINSDLSLEYPLCYYGSAEEGVLILENLKLQGYSTVETKIGIRGQAVELVLEQLAQLHATSYHFLQTVNMESFKALSCQMYRDTWSVESVKWKEASHAFINNIISGCVEILKNNQREDLASHLASLQKSTSTSYDILNSINKPRDEDFNVLIHGDIWNNNMMFKEINGTLSIKLLDLQIMRVTRPSLDLCYFFCTSTNVQERTQLLPNWLTLYYKHLEHYIMPLGYDLSKLMTFEEFEKDINDSWLYGYILGCMMAQITLTDDAKVAGGAMDMNGLEDEAQWQDFVNDFGSKLVESASKTNSLAERIIQLTEEAVRKNAL